ncbi:hypothetical protein E1J28_22495 [Xanthomonas hortorum pv. vitians]|nr:hypothetical protein BI317_22730 [Xanthomonas hortorum pv. gardneri]NMI20178.1 hypothetical protein [Xanthomonas hortorum pv. vitians]
MALLVSGEITMKSSDFCVRLLGRHAVRRIAHEIAVDQAHLERVGQTIDSGRDALRGRLIAAQRGLSIWGQFQSFKPVRKFLGIRPKRSTGVRR